MPFEQAMLFAVTLVVLSGTLIVWIVAYRRMYGKRKDDDQNGE